MPSKTTGHRPPEVQIKVLQVSRAPSEDADQDEQPPISSPNEHNTPKSMAYYDTVERILSHQAHPDLNLAMQRAATACGLHKRSHQEQETVTPHSDLCSMFSAIWRNKRDLHTAIHSHNSHAQRNVQRIAARLETTRGQLRDWQERRAKDLAQEQQRYLKNPKPYKSLKHVDKVLGETGHQGIRAVRLQDGTLTNNPKDVIEEVLNTFKRRHNAEDGELSDYTKNLISHLPTLYNQMQRRKMHRTPFTIRALNEMFHKPKPGKSPGVDGLPATLCGRLPLNLKRHLTAHL